MRRIEELTRKELIQLKKTVDEKYEGYKKEKLALDMSRGKPCKEQLDLARGFFDNIEPLISEEGIDCRNYGVLTGLKEVRELFAALLEVEAEEVIIGENSSLAMIYDTFARAFSHGVAEGAIPWGKLDKVKFLCPSPGYDRHFSICEFFGIEMITVPINEDGPDMDLVEELVSTDESIKGIICVPKFSNPTGIVYSEDTVNRLAAMKTAAEDFRIFWDNAYLVHDLSDKKPILKNLLAACKEYNNPDRAYIFTSTSKITFAGAGVAVFAASKNNIAYMSKLLSIQTIGSNKINQLLHYRFLKSVDGILEHMEKHARILKPKFDLVLDIFERELGGLGIATWTKPEGGYFISLNVLDGCARKVVELAREAGVVLTPAGATFPYGKDPRDRNIRIAPSFPPLEELEKAMEVVSTCIKKVSLEKLLEEKESATTIY